MGDASETTTTPQATMPPQLILRQWVNELADTGMELSPGILLPMAVERFSTDPMFVQGLLQAAMPGLVSEALRMTVGTKRAAARRGTWFVTDGQLSAKQRARWERWYESNGSTYQPLKTMRRDDLNGAITIRSAQIATGIATVEFLRTLQAGLRSDFETIEQRYSDTELAEIHTRFFGDDNENDSESEGQ